MTTKPYQTTVEPRTTTGRTIVPVLEFVAVWMLAAVCAILGIAGGGSALSMEPSARWRTWGKPRWHCGAAVLAALCRAAAYARLEHGVAYGSREPKIKTTREMARRAYPHRGDPERPTAAASSSKGRARPILNTR